MMGESFSTRRRGDAEKNAEKKKKIKAKAESAEEAENRE